MSVSTSHLVREVHVSLDWHPDSLTCDMAVVLVLNDGQTTLPLFDTVSSHRKGVEDNLYALIHAALVEAELGVYNR